MKAIQIFKNNADEINSLHEQIQKGFHDAVQRGIRIGGLLLEEKSKLKHGEWIPWIEKKLNFGRKQANKYTQIHLENKLLNDASKRHLEQSSIDAALKEIREIKNKDKRDKRRAEKESNFLTEPDLIHGDFSKIEDEIEKESIDWIITDPPYPKEYLPLYGKLAEFAAKFLKPGGSLICMIGQSYLPTIIRKFDEHLEYHWICAFLTPGPTTQIFHRKIYTTWKPLLWYKKDPDKGEYSRDVFKSPAPEKDIDEWQQSEAGMIDIIGKLTLKGQLICDPFMGTGTTGFAASLQGRNFIGIEVDEKIFNETKKRLEK